MTLFVEVRFMKSTVSFAGNPDFGCSFCPRHLQPLGWGGVGWDGVWVGERAGAIKPGSHTHTQRDISIKSYALNYQFLASNKAGLQTFSSSNNSASSANWAAKCIYYNNSSVVCLIDSHVTKAACQKYILLLFCFHSKELKSQKRRGMRGMVIDSIATFSKEPAACKNLTRYVTIHLNFLML